MEVQVEVSRRPALGAVRDHWGLKRSHGGLSTTAWALPAMPSR